MSTSVLSRPEGSTRSYPAYSRPLWRRVLFTREFAVIALLVAVIFYSNNNVPNFDGPLTFYYLFLDIAPILLIALPMTLVIITGEIDLSVASVVGLSSVLVAQLHVDAGLSIPVAGLIAILVGALCGAFNGFLVAYVGLPVAGRHDRHARALPRHRGRPARHQGGHRLPGEVDRPGQAADRRGLAVPDDPDPVRRAGDRCSRCCCTSRRSAAGSSRSGSTTRRRTSPASTSSAPSSCCS